MMAGSSPKPTIGTATASTATGGKVWPIDTTVSIRGRNCWPAGRVIQMPTALPTATENALDTPTNTTCCHSNCANDSWV